MALNFPDSPTLDQVYTDTTSGFSYQWDGTVWKSYAAATASTIQALDDISSGFDGSEVNFALTVGGAAVYPTSDQQLIVNLGGVIQNSLGDYNISGSTITFSTAPAAGLSFSGTLLGVGIPIDYANSGNVYDRQTYTATAGQTSFTFTATYAAGYLDVYRNGVRLSSGTDYTATNGTSFVLTTPAQLNDEIEAVGYKVKTITTTIGDVVNLKATGISTLSTTLINGGGINVTGVVTATSFSGNLSGNATGLSGSPNITVGNITSGNINSSGIVTAITLNVTNSNPINLNVSGVTTSTRFNVGAAQTINATGINVTGVVTATSFVGDGSGLTGAGATLNDDTTTNATYYPVFSTATSGSLTTAKVSSTKLTYNPSTGEATAVNFNSTSDINLKTNIQTVQNALTTVNSLRGVSFDWKESGLPSYGVIAQELEQILPELVKGEEQKSVNYNGIIGVLIEAIKELKAEVEELKNDK